MRCVAGVGLLLLVGCNQIFGISETQPWDAPPPVHYATVTRLIAACAPGGGPGTPAPTPFAASAGLVVRIASLDGAFAPVDVAGDGRLKIPAGFVDDGTGKPSTWRLEYTTADTAVAHEVQWSPDDNAGQIVVPFVGRLDRNTAPGGSGYSITPTVAQSYANPHVWTTGIWTDGNASVGSGSTVEYSFAGAQPLSDKVLGAPEAAKGDRAFLVDRVVDGGTQCSVVVGGAQLPTPDLTSSHTAASVVWDAQRKPVAADMVTLGFLDRLGSSLGNLESNFNQAGSFLLYGIVPSIEFPGLTASSAIFPLPIPVMQTLLQCPYNATPLPNAALPAGIADFPLVLHIQLVDSRDALGVRLYSGLETVIRPSASNFPVSFPAAMATAIKLATPAHPAPAALDLSGTADSVATGPLSGPFSLDFVTEPDPKQEFRADYFDVILHRITAGSLTTERIYTVTQPHVRVDPSVLAANADYVFEIRSYKGHRMAAHGDFATIDYPYGSAVVFTRTFKTP